MKTLSAIFLLIFCCGAALAQNGQEIVKTYFHVFPVKSFDYNGVFFKPTPEAEMSELRFQTLSRSIEGYDYQGAQPLTFYREDGVNAEGVTQYRPVGQVEVNSGELLVFFSPKSPSPNDTAEFNLLGMDDSSNGLPADHVAFINFTQIPFACRFVDKNSIIQPGPNKPISVREHLKEDILIGLAITNEDSHRVVLKSRWQFNPNNRHYILLLPPARKGSFRIQAFQISEFVGRSPTLSLQQ
jgi:hypothetical protein